MLDSWKEENIYIDGVPCQFLCHLQEKERAGIVYPAHYHDYIELLYGRNGSFRVYLNGSYHAFEAGDMALINANEVHQIEALSERGGQYVVVRFMPELIFNRVNRNHFEYEYLLPFITEDRRLEKVIPHDKIDNKVVPPLFDAILSEDRNREYGYELAVKNHIGSLYLWILRYWRHSGQQAETYKQADQELLDLLRPAFSYIAGNYEKPVTAAGMAKLCNLSSSYFSRSFNRLMRMGFHEYLNYVRVSEAEKLLISTSLSVTEIAVAVGFGTSSYFIKVFKEYKHISPKQFRLTLVQREKRLT